MNLKEVKAAVKADASVLYNGCEYIILSVNMFPNRKAAGRGFWRYSLELTTRDLRGCIMAPMEFVRPRTAEKRGEDSN